VVKATRPTFSVGRTVLTVVLMLQCCVCLSPSVKLCIVAKRSVPEQKLLLTAYKEVAHTWEIDWYQNEWPWPLFRLRIKSMSSFVNHCVTFAIEYLAI